MINFDMRKGYRRSPVASTAPLNIWQCRYKKSVAQIAEILGEPIEVVAAVLHAKKMPPPAWMDRVLEWQINEERKRQPRR
mgnify:CR=1 FL=1